MNKQKKTKLKRWLTGFGIGLIVILIGAGWYIDRMMTAIGEMRNAVYQEVKSPDGKYVATLAYSDGMTYGYYFVSLQTTQLWQPLMQTKVIFVLLVPFLALAQMSLAPMSSDAQSYRGVLYWQSSYHGYDHQAGHRVYWSPDHTLKARVVYRKTGGYQEAESIVKILTASGKLVAFRDCTSDGGGGGLTVVHGKWTPDSRFFVFSMESSGGHSPWHFPTGVFSRRRGRFFWLDDFVGAVITPKIRIVRSDIIKTRNLSRDSVWADLRKIEKKLTAASAEHTDDPAKDRL